jgi:hypothetical protein
MPRSPRPGSSLFRTRPRRLPLTAMVLESIGFIIIVCVSWLDELLDLPHYLFGAPVTPFRPQEAILESIVALSVGVAVVVFTGHLVRQLEGSIVLCAWCRRVRVDGEWMSIEELMLVHRAKPSHGMCAECAVEHEIGTSPR